jgi:hypothetical protein
VRPTTYEIRLDGTLSAEDLAELAGMMSCVDGGSTVLRGLILDQPTLVGLLARVEGLGCTVRELRVVVPHVGDAPVTGGGPGDSDRPGPASDAAPGGGTKVPT